MQNTRKLFLVLTFAAMLLVLGGTALAQSSGTCGENLTWVQSDYVVLTLPGIFAEIFAKTHDLAYIFR